MSRSLALSTEVGDQPNQADLLDLTEMVEAIGSDDFAGQFLSCIDRLVGADYCVVYQLTGLELVEVTNASFGAVPLSDPTPYEIRRQISMAGASIRVDVSMANYSDAITVKGRSPRRHRIMISARRKEAAYCVCVIRFAHRPELNENRAEALRLVAGTLMSAVAKHLDIKRSRPNPAPALCTLAEIEKCLLSATDLSRREGEVCARILSGLSSREIALDLGIGKESVFTYRKRAYQRLGIGSQHELLMRYLALWGTRPEADVPSPRHGPGAAHDRPLSLAQMC